MPPRTGYRVFNRPMVQLVMGRCGVGKTYFTDRRLIPALLADGRDVALIHDPHPEHEANYSGTAWRGVEHFRRGWAAGKVLTRRNVFRRVEPAEVIALGRELARLGWRVVVVVDELNRVATRHGYLDGAPRKAREPRQRTPLETLIREHRHERIDFVGTIQRPVDLHVDFTSAAGRMWIFALRHSRDVEWVEEQTDEATAARVRALGVRQFVEWNPDDVSDLQQQHNAPARRQEVTRVRRH